MPITITFDPPDTQINFAKSLTEIRSLYLQDALASTVASMEIDKIDSELHDCIDNHLLQILARHGMRGELLFALPCILEKNPRLLGGIIAFYWDIVKRGFIAPQLVLECSNH